MRQGLAVCETTRRCVGEVQALEAVFDEGIGEVDGELSNLSMRSAVERTCDDEDVQGAAR